MRPINLERLHEATDAQLAEAHTAALVRAHDAPFATYCLDHDGHSHLKDHRPSWATFTQEAIRIHEEIRRRIKA